MRDAHGLWSRTRRWIGLPVICACVLLLPAPGLAQIASPAEPASTASESSPQESGARHPRRLYFGMWTTHLKHDVVALDNNWAIGVSCRGFFGATYLNSFGRRAFAGGLQRTILASGRRPIGASLGYRLGFVTGYDGRFMRLARNAPVLPLVQPFASIDVHRLGFEVSYTFVVMSLAVSFKF